jgi:hypothetical protein
MPEYYKENRRVQHPDRKSDEYLGLKPNSYDWARLAAYRDGEGSINFAARKATGDSKSITLLGRVQVTNTFGPLIVWCCDTFGMRFHIQKRNSQAEIARERNWKECYFSTATSYRACWILHNCLPWFIVKAEQAKLVMDHQESIGPDVWKRGSGVQTPHNILDYRAGLRKRLQNLNHRGPDKPEINFQEELNSKVN